MIIIDVIDVNYIITPKVLEFARRHFNNKNMKGLPMDYSISIPF